MKQLSYIHIQDFSNPKERFEVRLRCICTPTGHRAGIFTNLFGQPFCCPVLLDEYYFYSI